MSGKLSLREFFARPPLPSTGVSIHRHAVAVACTRRAKGKLFIQRAAVEPLPAGVIEPAFDGVNIKNRDALGEALGRALASAGLKRRTRWCMALPAAACRMFLLDLDEVPPDAKELAQILEWKAERFLGMAAGELTLACERIMSGPTGGRFLVVAVRTDVLTAYESVLTGLGLHPGWVVPVPIAEAGWLFHSASGGDSLLVSYEDELVTFVFGTRRCRVGRSCHSLSSGRVAGRNSPHACLLPGQAEASKRPGSTTGKSHAGCCGERAGQCLWRTHRHL